MKLQKKVSQFGFNYLHMPSAIKKSILIIIFILGIILPDTYSGNFLIEGILVKKKIKMKKKIFITLLLMILLR